MPPHCAAPPQTESARRCTPEAKELDALREENAWLRRKLEQEQKQWRLLRVSSPLTAVRFGTQLNEPKWGSWAGNNGLTEHQTGAGDGRAVTVAWSSHLPLPVPAPADDQERSEGNGWRWWPTWCPCCRRPLDVTGFRSESDWESVGSVGMWQERPNDKREEEAVMHIEEPEVQAAASQAQGKAAMPEVRAAASQTQGKAATLDVQAAASQAQGKIATNGDPPAPQRSRYAYVAALWGYNSGFVLGALVLGAALRHSGTKHDLVLLHSDDISRSSCRLLAEVWRLREVDFIKADERLFSLMGSRFDGVFTKLHALGLTEYAKVLVLDLDLAVLACPDDLFELPPPAAVHRAVRGAAHGSRVDGRNFFAGEALDADSMAWEWGQASGINAGVMLLAPDGDLYQRVLKEISMPVHPEHIPGNGPEQDYLSRLFAPWWTHIGVAYNYQLHRTFHALEGAVHRAAYILGSDGSCDPQWHPERLVLRLEELKLIHFSGHLKMWDRDFASGQDDLAFAQQLLRDCAGDYMRIWVDRAGESYEYAALQLRLEEGVFVHEDPAVGKAVTPLIEHAVDMALGAARLAVQSWREMLQALPSLYPGLPELPALFERVRHPESLPDAPFQCGARVEYWSRGCWFPGTVRATHDDGTVSLEFDEAGFWGCGVRHIWPNCLRPIYDDASSTW